MENGMLKLLILLILLLSFPDETFQFNFRKEKLQFQSFLSKRLHKLPLSKQNAGEIEKPSFLESFIKSQYEISLGAGIMGLVLILLNRSIVWNDGGISVDSFNAVSDIRSRADLIAAIGCTGLLLNIFSDSSEFNFINKEVIDKNIRERDKIALVGHYLAKPLFTALPSLTEVEQERLSWLFEAIQASIPTVTSAHCFDIDRLTVKGVIGVVNLQATQSLLEPDQSDLKSTAKILQSPIAKNEELYLPDLQVSARYVCSR